MRPLALVVFSSLACACGGGGELTGPRSAQAPASVLPVPQAVDGVTGAAVSASFTPARPGLGERTVVEAPGYLVREQAYRGEPVNLWPAREERLVRQLVYLQGSTGAEIRLRRWQPPGFTLALSAEIAAIPRAREAFERAAAEASEIAGLAIGIAASGAVRVVVDPTAFAGLPPSCAVARLWLAGDVVTRAEIAFPSLDAAAGLGRGCDRFGVAAHELGHVLGLQHVDDAAALMHATLAASSYSAWEAESLRVMYHHRRAGNGAPDRDAELVAGEAPVRVERIVD